MPWSAQRRGDPHRIYTALLAHPSVRPSSILLVNADGFMYGCHDIDGTMYARQRFVSRWYYFLFSGCRTQRHNAQDTVIQVCRVVREQVTSTLTASLQRFISSNTPIRSFSSIPLVHTYHHHIFVHVFGTVRYPTQVNKIYIQAQDMIQAYSGRSRVSKWNQSLKPPVRPITFPGSIASLIACNLGRFVSYKSISGVSKMA